MLFRLMLPKWKFAVLAVLVLFFVLSFVWFLMGAFFRRNPLFSLSLLQSLLLEKASIRDHRTCFNVAVLASLFEIFGECCNCTVEEAQNLFEHKCADHALHLQVR